MVTPVTISRMDGIAVVTIDSPPVNTMSRDVRAGLREAFGELRAAADVRAIVLACAGRTFISGGDMREFETGILEPGYGEPMRLIENSPVPVVAAIHGTAMGAGVETALCCHWRVASARAQFAMPEITLGIIPGAGGTQRLPRLVGLAPALDLMLTGKAIGAAQAREIGLVDAVVDGDVRDGAVAFARELVAANATPRRTRDRTVAAEGATEVLAARRAEVAKTMRNRNSPHVLLDAVQAAVELPFDAGLARERELSDQVERAVEGRAFRHLFFGEREVRRIPGLPAEVKPRAMGSIGIVGAGTMGSGIAMCFANAGLPVTIVDTEQAAIDRGMGTIRKNYERSVSRGSLKPELMAERLALIAPSLEYEALSGADLVIEAVFENLALKKEIFSRLDRVAKPGAILGTNTSSLDIDEIAAVTGRPQDVIGLHFFSPANVMRLLEIVQAKRTAPDVLVTALEMARAIKKVGVVAKVCYGFIGNRMMEAYGREAERCVMEGATPADVDGAMEDFGMAMGLLAVFDLAGVDIGHLMRAERAHLLPNDPTFYRPSALLTERGWLGQKSGRGYYRYDNPERRRTPDPESVALFRAEARRLGVPQRKPSQQEIQDRCLCALANEGARILEEGVALRASDIDIVYTAGYGFPRYRGGPMFYADSVGLQAVYEKTLELQRSLGDQSRYWAPAPLLAQLAQRGSSFAQWQKENAR
jgi:3-hydroxyacyl-CoA dehydrogenase